MMNSDEKKAMVKMVELISKTGELSAKRFKLILERYQLIKEVTEKIDWKIIKVEKENFNIQSEIWKLSQRCEDTNLAKIISAMTESYVKAGGILRD